MFGKKRKATVDIVRRNIVGRLVAHPVPPDRRERHDQLRATFESYRDHSVEADLVQRLTQSGFTIIVGDKFVASMKYAASVTWPRTDDDPGHWPVSRLAYVGDMPEFAIERAQKAVANELKWVTIHSNQPLDVRSMTRLDAVLVGWRNNPNIVRWGDIWGGDGNNRLHLDRRGQTGLIIAMWDTDKEITL